jgi:glycosyltransferase involved in cell wall biosynthesis
VKICFFNRSYWPDQAATGQLLTELAEDLVARHGCEVTVVAGSGLNPSGVRPTPDTTPPSVVSGLSRTSSEEHHGVRILRARGTTLRPKRFAARATNYVTYAASAALASLDVGRPDVIVALTDPPIIGRVALWAARRTGARFVFLCEDIFPEVASLLEDFHSTAVNRALDRMNRHLLREADAIVALGDRMRRRLVEEKGASADRIQVIHNWADCDAIRPGSKDNPFARQHGLADKFVVMHSGNVGLSQNLDVLIDAAERLRSNERVVLVVVGDGARRERLERAAAERRLTNLRFLAYQPKSELHDSFAAADAFLISLKPGLEGYIVPSKLYGILAAGRPYVAAVDPSCEVAQLAVAHDCGVLAAPGDPAALADAIEKLCGDPAAARTMGERARALALQYDRRAAVAAYHELFSRVARLAQAA